jgi:hypothetical protein
MTSSRHQGGRKQYHAWIANQLLNRLKDEADVLALFWHGSFPLGRWSSGSDLDAAVLLRPNAYMDVICESLLAPLQGEVRLQLRNADRQRLVWFAGEHHLKVEIVFANNPDQLAWLADARDVPAPRMILAFERDGAGQSLRDRANRVDLPDASEVANREIEKFVEGFEACSRAHSRSDAYAFYFHYNLALGRLARLIQIVRHRPERLYLPPQLTNSRLRLEERQGFIDLAGTLYLPEANKQKRKLAEKFLEVVGELTGRCVLARSVVELREFLDAICLRDFLWNVRDWADHLDGWVKPGVVFRASTLTRWQGEQELRNWILRHEVRQIIDLRTDKPKDGSPYGPGILAEVDYVRKPMIQEGPMDEADRSEHYLGIALQNMPAIVDVLRALAQAEGCSVVHCYRGVDRTGVLMALLGELLSIPRQLIVDDYAASGSELHRHSMARFLDEVDRRGGAVGLLRAAGLDVGTENKLRHRLLRSL